MTETDENGDTVWFIDALDTDTNNYLMQFSDVRLHPDIECKDGIPRNLYEVSRPDIERFKNDTRSLGLKGNFYIQPNGSNVPERTNLPLLPRRNVSRERRRVIKIAGQLKKARKQAAPF